LPAFFEKEEGFVVSACINKFMHMHLEADSSHHFWLKYSKEEVALKVSEIKHPIIRSCFQHFTEMASLPGLKLSIQSDIPSGTGLGSSSAFTVGLLNLLQAKFHKHWDASMLAELASYIEIEKLGAFIGKQDQYCAAFGGFNSMRFLAKGGVEVKKLEMPDPQVFQSSLCLFFTGLRRDGAKVLEKERKNLNIAEIIKMRDLAKDFAAAIHAGEDTQVLGDILDSGWQIKKSLNPEIANSEINEAYKRAMAAGAYGGKLLGAGGGGYMLFLCKAELQKDLEKALSPMQRLPIEICYEGSKILGDTNG